VSASRKVRTEHHHRRRLLRGRGYFTRVGPGLITGAADDDPSGIGTYSQVGAAFGFGLLWTCLISLPLAAAVQETAARLGLVCGKGLATLIRERFPKPVLYMALALVVGANSFNIGADLRSMGAAMRLIVPVPPVVSIAAMTLVLLVLEIFVSYATYSKILRFLCLSLLAYIGVLFVAHVGWGGVAAGTFDFHVRFTRPFLAALIAVLGTTISPYLFFWQAGEELEERREHHAGFKQKQLRLMRVDVFTGMTSAVAVMFAIIVASATTLGAHGIHNIQTADQAAQALRPVAGPAAGMLFAIGIVGTGLLAVPVLAGSTAYAISEAMRWSEGLSKHFRQARGFYGVIIATMGLGLVLDVVGVNPIRALFLAAVLNGLAAPPLLLLMLILSNTRAELGAETGGRVSSALVGVAFLLMTGAPIAYVFAR
jgi:NRAMP (natural resistance-associated macrophage protein)-like metal ion transporter